MTSLRALDRKELLDALAAESHREAVTVRDVGQLVKRLPDDHRLGCVWESAEDLPSLPSLIVVPNGELHDFAAWMITYLRVYGPITAMCRLVERQEIERLSRARNTLGDLEGACVGAAIGEAWALYALAGKRSNPSLPACLSTFSFASARLGALGYGNDYQGEFLERWSASLSLTDQPQRPLAAGPVAEVWRTLWGVLRPSRRRKRAPLLGSACEQLRTLGGLEPDLIAELTDDKNLALALVADGSREDRVVQQGRIQDLVGTWPRSRREIASFLLGYTASRVSPGSLSHLELLESAVRDFPTAPIWYGICAGIFNRSTLLSSEDALGWRVLRELLSDRSLLHRPRCDVALTELQLLRGHGGRIPTRTTSAIEVEVAPYCTVPLRQRELRTTGARQVDLFPEEATTPEAVISVLRRALSDAERALRALPRRKGPSG